MMLTKQAEITSAVGTTDEQLMEVGKTLEDLNITGDNQVEASLVIELAMVRAKPYKRRVSRGTSSY